MIHLSRRAFLASAPLLAAGCKSAPTGDVSIGHIEPPGDTAEARGLELALDALRADPAGWPQGRPVRVIHADAGGTPRDAQNQAARLASLNKVAALIGGRCGAAEKLAEAAAAESLPTVLLSGDVGGDATDFAFALGLSPGDVAKALAEWLKLKKGDGAAVYRDDARFSIRSAAAFAAACRAAGAVPEESLVGPSGPLIGSAKAAYFAGSLKAARSWADLMRTKLAAAAFGGDEAELPAAEKADAGSKLVAATSFRPTGESGRAFAARYRSKYAAEPPPAAALAYEALTVLVEAARRAGSWEAKPVRDALAGREPYPGLSGEVTFAGGTARRPVFVVEI